MSVRKKYPLVVGIGFSPREGGNSDTLLEWALGAVNKKRARVKKFFIRDLKINHCLGCRYCEKYGECIQRDDFQRISAEIERADFLVIASPVFFLGIPGHSKAMIDRFQTFWSRKYLLDRGPEEENRPALLLMVSGAKQTDIFECVKRTIKAFFDVCGFKLKVEVPVRGIDEKAEVRKVPGLKKRVKMASERLLTLG